MINLVNMWNKLSNCDLRCIDTHVTSLREIINFEMNRYFFQNSLGIGVSYDGYVLGCLIDMRYGMDK